MGEQVKANTDRLVAQTKPDLITLSGDNAWGSQAYMMLIKMLDAYGVEIDIDDLVPENFNTAESILALVEKAQG